jgi:protein involved in polysaccharide export with SLBB domain
MKRGIIALAAILLAHGSLPAQASNGAEPVARRSADTKLRAGDQIALNFIRDRELNSTVTVNERGQAPFPKLGLMLVTNLTITQLEDSLRSRYAEYLRTPEFEISVLRRVAVIGEVRAPNVYLVDPATTLRDVIARAGGIGENGSRSRVSVVRGNERMTVKDWDRATGTSFPLESGDQVVVGRKNWFLINALSAVSTAVLVASLIITIHRN